MSYGRTRAIVGQLVDENGTPIGTPCSTSSRPRHDLEPRPASIGQIATERGPLPVPAEIRDIEEAHGQYRAFHLDDAPSAAATLTLSVRAGVTLSVTPRRVSSRGPFGSVGGCAAGPGAPARRWSSTRWVGGGARIPVATVRANAKGRFRYRYRFSNSSPGVTYRFQATMHSQRSYPYATGNSRPATVRIR